MSRPAGEPWKKSGDGESERPGRVSVLLPLKNGLPHLHDAMASLIAQTYPDVEILVIDDGSEDGGPEEIQGRALSHVRVVPSNGQGIAAALNTGLKLATGEFIARHDADDWSHPERLARQAEYLLRHPEIDVLTTCAEFVDVEGRPAENAWTSTVRRQHDAVQTPADLARLLPRTCAIHHATMMARRDVLRAAGGYRSAFVCAQEYDLSLRLLPQTRIREAAGEALHLSAARASDDATAAGSAAARADPIEARIRDPPRAAPGGGQPAGAGRGCARRGCPPRSRPRDRTVVR